MRGGNSPRRNAPRLGQHFLVSERILERIATAACGERVPLAVEIGPGKGALTGHLLRHADRVVAIELDRDLAAQTRERWGENNLSVVEGDALDADWSRWGPGVLTGNLPYYVATPLISGYLEHPGLLNQGVFLIQKEVAERITAAPGRREYGYFSVECQLLAEVEYLFTVKPGAFRPPPAVDSAVIGLRPRAARAVNDTASFLSFLSVCFRQKRKTLRNNLAAVYPAALFEGRAETSRRAEQLGLEEFAELFRLIQQGSGESQSTAKNDPHFLGS